MKRTSITDYTESEFLSLVEQIFKENVAETDDVLDELLELFETITEHPDGSDLIYYPEYPDADTPENIVRIVKRWRQSQGLPCFKE
ncbi:bacteriocin immunity protein [Vibrio parahaemolyticus]|uniref:bacteriocin immunity protein n=1 Tax=Vibrio parahaemolyticus TaxID=670 RepID=UPI001869838D|nr:bacteriocin immunity protein [Vibrio parahaemolyticus]MBE3793602.1 bacteriocin immunity protein [Vibrio parahaemolyticus]MBE3866462.1 bacteriocin immunity protein [Vibrio parahaemolyticus]MCC3796986.1 bacteriocin immunity protein [Vibrio parahaemolyticus]MCC3811537.1 bacteriocin immunity protein [Vibrio parahaemolyticus]MCZ5880769.1 bacteriocin immunity protein [Vibrio parahaemolyticus]